MTFENKVVVVTGGGTGIGKAAARMFVRRGARVVINGRRLDVLEATARELDPRGDRVAVTAGDIGTVATARRTFNANLEGSLSVGQNLNHKEFSRYQVDGQTLIEGTGQLDFAVTRVERRLLVWRPTQSETEPL